MFIKRFLILFLGLIIFWVFHKTIGIVIGTKPNNIYNDFEPLARALLNGEFIGTRYPPFHVIWTAFRIKISEWTGLSYFNISVLLYYPIFILSYLQLKKFSGNFDFKGKSVLIYSSLFLAYPLYFLSLHLDLSLIWYSLFLIIFANCSTKIFEAPLLSTKSNIYVLKSGFFLGLASLIRPNPLALPLFLAIVLGILLFFKKRIFFLNYKKTLLYVCVLFSITYAATISPWSIYSSLKAEKTNILSQGFLPSHRDGLRRFPPYLSKEFVNTNIKDLSSALSFHTEMFLTKPAFYIKVWALKTVQCWYASDSGKWDLIFGAINLVYIVLFFIGIKNHTLDFKDFFVISLIVYHWLLSIIVLSIARYQTPIFPFISIYSAIGLLKITGKIKGKYIHG